MTEHKHRLKIIDVNLAGYVMLRCQEQVFDHYEGDAPPYEIVTVQCKERVWAHRSFFSKLTTGQYRLVPNGHSISNWKPQWLLEKI